MPLYKKRNAILTVIPQFWLTALENHSLFGDMIEEHDKDVLSFLKSIEVERPADDYKTYKVIFDFNENPFLVSTTLTKEITSMDDGEVEVKSSPIEWKEGKNVMLTSADGAQKGGQEPKTRDSFFQFFGDDSEDAAELINMLLTVRV